MTDKQNMTRGYDDSIYLKETADGIVVRRFASVDEAARSVLGGAAGSNVDRLRRKFREQGWYERGLGDYVEAEILRRTQEPVVNVSQHLTVDEQGLATRTFPNAWFQGIHTVGRELKSTGTMAFLSVVTTTALYVGLLHPCVLVPATALSCFISLAALLSWIASVAKDASLGAALRHIVSLATLFAAVVFAVHGAERGHGAAVSALAARRPPRRKRVPRSDVGWDGFRSSVVRRRREVPGADTQSRSTPVATDAADGASRRRCRHEVNLS